MTLSALDWIVMLVTQLGIVAYGVWKTRSVKSVESYLLGDKDLHWWTIGLSIMATQASAITFLSTPGQAYDDGMRFAQFYFGMPVAMVILCVFFLPIYYRLKVYTAYEYLESRFDLKTRTITAILFLLSRGMAAGITIYAPSIILSTILGWDLTLTNLCLGAVVIVYTVAGGTKAVSVTQTQQMAIIFIGLILTAVILVFKLPEDVAFGDAVGVAGKMGKLNVVDFTFDLENRYTFWSGMLGGVFLFLSYFGTDQSQVQRYLSGKSLTESRFGLLFNGIVKVPMQVLVLFTGILVFVFFQFNQPPLHFNKENEDKILESAYAEQYRQLQQEQTAVFEQKQLAVRALMNANQSEDETAIASARAAVSDLQKADKDLRTKADELIKQANPGAEIKDEDYVFITFVMRFLPIGMIGLLLSVIFSAALSSIASELNALATTSVIDIYKRSFVTNQTDHHYLSVSKWFTIGWGILALMFAEFAALFDNLIQAVNIVGSLFYGVILGIFMTGFFLKKVRGNAVFWGAVIAELLVITTFYLSETGVLKISFLWLNLIGCALVMLFSWKLQFFFGRKVGEIG